MTNKGIPSLYGRINVMINKKEWFNEKIAAVSPEIMSEVQLSADLRRLEEDETRPAAIRAALIDGEESGVAENFDSAYFVQKLNAQYDAEIQAL